MASPRLRIGRHSLAGASYMVTTVTAARRPIFVADAAAREVKEMLSLIEEQRQVLSVAWVVMPDHLHWLFELRGDSLSSVVQQFKSRSARVINSACGGQGTVWQPGFYDHRIREGEDLLAQARYVLANPVRRGLVERIGVYPHAWCRYGSGVDV